MSVTNSFQQTNRYFRREEKRERRKRETIEETLPKMLKQPSLKLMKRLDETKGGRVTVDDDNDDANNDNDNDNAV